MRARPSANSPSRRPGRFRRWLLRPAVWLVVGVVLAAVGAYFAIDSDYAHERVRGLLVTRLSQFLGRPVELAAVDYTLLPPSLTAHRLTVPSPDPADPPFARIGRVGVEIALGGTWRRVKLAIGQVSVVEPEIELILAADGTTNLPEFATGDDDGGGGRVEVTMGALLVERGAVRFEDREIPLDFTARSVWGRLVGPPGPLNARRGPPPRFTFSAAADEVTAALPEAVPYAGSLSVEGAISPGQVELTAGRLAGPDLTARLAGHYRWDRETRQLRLEIDADGGAALANRLGYLDEPIDGRFGLVGEVDAPAPDGGAWGYRGTVRSPEIAFLGRRFTEVAAEVRGGVDGLRVDLARAGYAGGTASGSLTVETGTDPLPMNLELRLVDAALAPILADQEVPLTGLTGRADGDLTYRFTSADPTGGDGWATVTLAAVQRRPGAVPLSGEAPLTIQRGVVTSEAIRVEAAGQQATGSGAVDLATGAGHLVFSLDTEDLGGLSALLPQADDPEVVPWLPTAGSGTIEGRTEFDAAGAAGSLTLDLVRPETPQLAVDGLRGGLYFKPDRLHDLRLEATLGEGALMVTGDLPLPAEGEPPASEAGGIQLAFDVAAWPAASLAFLLPQPPPVELGGAVSGRVTVSGGFDALAGEADVEAAPLVLSGFTVDRAAATVGFDPQRVAITQVAAELPAGAAAATGSWDLTTDALSLSLTAPSLDLAAEPLASFAPGDLGGRLTVAAEIAGTFAEPEVSLTVSGRDLTLGGRPLGERGGTELIATWREGRVDGEGSLLGLLTLAGGGRLDGEAVDLRFDLAGSDLAALVELATGQAVTDFAGDLAGALTVAGEVAGPAPIAARLELDRLAARFQGHPLANLEPVVVRLVGDQILIDSFFVGEAAGAAEDRGGAAASELFVAGSVDLGGEETTLALNVQGSLAATWAEPLFPWLDADGRIDLLGTVRGTPSDPRVNGQGEVQRGRAIIEGFPHSLDDLTATVLFYPNQAVLDSLKASFAGGTLRAAGRVDLTRLAEGEIGYRFQFTGSGLSVRYPEGFLLRGDANVTLQSTEDGRQIVGTADLERAFYLEDVPVRVGQLLQRLLQRQRVEAGETDEDLASTQLNLSVRGPGALRVRNNLADLTGDLDLTVRGTLANPAVFGTVEVDAGGTIVYAENKYRVERGLLTFANPYRIDPVIDLVATTEVRDYDVTLQLSGTLDRLDATFTSDPPLADLDVLALLTTGQTLGRGGQIGGTASGADSQGGAQTFLYGQAASVVTERVNQLFGFDQLRVNPIAGSGGGGTSVAFTVGKQISRDLYVTYSRDPTTSLDYLLQAEWQVARGVTLVLTQNGNQSYAVDVLWEKRF